MNDETLYAFPHKFQSSPNETTVCFGMTLRDYFAAKAMQADMNDGIHEDDFAWSTKRAYKMADEMLRARALKGEANND